MTTRVRERHLRSQCREAGVTVVELLLAGFVLLILLGGLGALLVASNRGYASMASVSESLQDSEAVLQLLRYDVGLAGYKGIGDSDYSRQFSLDGFGNQSTVEIAGATTGHSITVRYFEDRYVGVGDTGERRITYVVDPDTLSLNRSEKNPVDGERDFALMVGNVVRMEALSIIDEMRVETMVSDLPKGEVLGTVAGITIRVDFLDGQSWDLLIGFANPQLVEVM